VILEKTIYFPPIDRSIKKKTFIFDLDETLIHCESDLKQPNDFVVKMEFPNGNKAKAGIRVRPGAIQTLRMLKPFAEIIVFTASHKCYMTPILNKLDPNNELIDHRFSRINCYVNKQNV